MLVSKGYSTFSGLLVVGLGARRHVIPYQIREDNLGVPPKHLHSSDWSSLLACLTKYSREHANVITGRSHIIPYNVGEGSHIRTASSSILPTDRSALVAYTAFHCNCFSLASLWFCWVLFVHNATSRGSPQYEASNRPKERCYTKVV